MLRNLSHPAIVSVHDAYKDVDSFAIVMQLVEGGDLFDRVVKRGHYPESDARDTMVHLLSALAYLHARGIAHRDVKPENILLRTKFSDVDVLLTDFGLAKGAAVLELRSLSFTSIGLIHSHSFRLARMAVEHFAERHSTP